MLRLGIALLTAAKVVLISVSSQAQAGGSVTEKARTAVQEREYLEEEARASRLSHRIAVERERKRREILGRFRIQAGADPCLAYHRAAGRCAVSVDEFNAASAIYLPDFPDSVSESDYAALARKTRRIVLGTLLENAYLSEMHALEQASPGPDSDPMAGPAGHPDPSLVARFRKRYPDLLAADPSFRVKVLAASDSLVLDALLRDGAGRHVLNTFAPQSLPKEVLSDLMGLRPGTWTSIRKVSFGFLALSPVGQLPDIRDAHLLLFNLDEAAASDSGREREARKYYREHSRIFFARDTLDLRIRLVPRLKARGMPVSGSSGAPKAPTFPVAAGEEIAPVRVLSTGLPDGLAAFVEERLEAAQVDSIGPLEFEFGTWTFILLGRKPGRGQLSFEEARPEVAALIQALDNRTLLRLSIERARSKITAGKLARMRSALIRDDGSEVLPEGDSQAFTKTKQAWIAENILVVYPLEE